MPFEVDPELQDVAVRIAEALQLDVFGADIILGPDGPAVIDVNPFPGFRGVRDARRLIAIHILAISHSQV